MRENHEPHGIPTLRMFGQHRVPWFVTIWEDGKPEFRVVDPVRWNQAVHYRLCWICGEEITHRLYAFPIGPMCTINRVSADPACHLACSVYAAIHCPFLNDPDRVRRTDDLTDYCEEKAQDWGAIMRNPGITAIWACKKFTVERGAGTKMLVRLGNPRRVLWYYKGAVATRSEVELSIASGIHLLSDLAEQEGPLAIAALETQKARAKRYWPRV